MQSQPTKIKLKLFPIVYRNILLEKKKTHSLGDQNRGEFLFYVNGQAKYYLNANETLNEMTAWSKQHNARLWHVVKKLLKRYDKDISSPDLLAFLFDWNSKAEPEEVELTVIPIEQLWSGLTETEKLALLQ